MTRREDSNLKAGQVSKAVSVAVLASSVRLNLFSRHSLLYRPRQNSLYVARSRPHGEIWLVHSNFDEVTLTTFRSYLRIVAKTILAAKLTRDFGKSRSQLFSIVGFVE